MSESLLKLQIGPVQDFIAQARSTRDLWSGSYLISWLMAAGTARLIRQLEGRAGFSREQALAAIISPSPGPKTATRAVHQPLLQLHLDHFDGIDITDASAALNDDRLTANFTNILVAALPAEQAGCAVRAMIEGIETEWSAIWRSVWRLLEQGRFVDKADTEFQARFEQQARTFPSITWQLTPGLDESKADLLLTNTSFPLESLLRQRLQANLQCTHDTFPAQIVLNSWQLDAVRQLREFKAWNAGGWRRESLPTEKDSLTGREEAIVGGEKWWDAHFMEQPGGKVVFKRSDPTDKDAVPWAILFRDRGDWLGAFTLIKRLWHIARLAQDPWRLHAGHRREPRGKQFPFPSTAHIALHDPAKNIPEDNRHQMERLLETEAMANCTGRYFAVLAMDGDEMGKWLSGENSSSGPTDEFRRDLSSRLSSFALRCVRPIVEACDGRLVYAGGEDIVALLPADTVMDCARFLRLAYRAEPGWLLEFGMLAAALRKAHHARDLVDPPNMVHPEREISPFLVAAALHRLFVEGSERGTLAFHPELEGKTEGEWPGPDTVVRLPGGLNSIGGTLPEISAGIAIAHYKEPLQDVVRAAHVALNEHAKSRLDRGAIAVSLIKHSGECVHWGCKWSSGGLELARELQHSMTMGELSRKFPHRLLDLLAPYEVNETGSIQSQPEFEAQVDAVLEREFRHVLKRQRGDHWPKDHQSSDDRERGITDAFARFLRGRPATNGQPPYSGLRHANGEPWSAQEKLHAVAGLLKTVAFSTPKAPVDGDSEPVNP